MDVQPSREILLESKRILPHELEAHRRVLERMKSLAMSDSDRAANFPMWARGRDIARFLARYEVFQRISDIPGAIIECGVHLGGGLASWIHLSEIFEPVAFTRRIYGFDTFNGFPSVSEHDLNGSDSRPVVGDFNVSASNEIIENLRDLDSARKIPNVDRLQIIQGDATKTIPEVVSNDCSLNVALLYLDFDLYSPTIVALRTCLPRMARGAVVVCDQFGDREWPGESKALAEAVGLSNIRLRSFSWIPRISFFVIGE